jgi:sugar phosphate isomerase/epimerase
MPVELALTPDSGWDTDIAGLVEATANAGFEALGIRAERAGNETAAGLDAAGLRCHEILALVLRPDEAETLAAAARLAEAAATMQARWVLTTFRAELNDKTARLIERCAAMFADAGARMAVEFSPLGPITSISKGMDIVKVAGPNRAGLMIDTWHFSFGDSTWDDLAQVPLDRIAYVQFTDALAPESDDLMHETIDRREVPGAGVLELERFASLLRGRGWEGLVSVEVLSSQLRELPVAAVVKRLRDATYPYWA